MELTMERKLHMYKQMRRNRTFEEKARKNFYNGKLQGFLHLSIGEEGVAGVMENLRKTDYVCATHRGHGVELMKGAETKLMFAELAGRATGLCKGRGGSMHMADIENGLLGSNGILGAGAPMMTGAALACKIEKRDDVAVCFFGDGQSDEGGVHEALNMAAALKLPIVFVCTNNLYGMWTSITKSKAISDVSSRAAGYGMPGVVVDGNDVVAVYEVAKAAIDLARKGGGPSFLELKTYRWFDHSVGLKDDFRPKEEVEEWKKKDPIKRHRENLIAEGVEESALEAIDNEAGEEIDAAFEFAMNSPFPDISVAYEDVYTNMEVEVDKA
ncbi:MAG: thiamine pyrophosphate-dependent dehydrogenase E1 component subunit alpha [Clostridiaceae bacterium]